MTNEGFRPGARPAAPAPGAAGAPGARPAAGAPAARPAGGMAGAPGVQEPLEQFNSGNAPGCPEHCDD